MRTLDSRLNTLDKAITQKYEEKRQRMVRHWTEILNQDEADVLNSLALGNKQAPATTIKDVIFEWEIHGKLFQGYEFAGLALPPLACQGVTDMEEWAEELPPPAPEMSYSERCKRIVAYLKELAEQGFEFEQPE